MKRYRVPYLALALCGLGWGAETAQERGKRVVEEALAAMGGPHYLAMEDRVETGRAYSFYRDQLSGLTKARFYARYLKRPEGVAQGWIGVRERQSFGKDESSGAVLFADGKGWNITFRGARPLPELRLVAYRDSTLRNILYILRQRLGEPGLITESRGADMIDNQPVEIVEIADADNRTVTVYFHRTTKLPVRQVFQRRNPQTKERDEEVTLFSKYRDVGGGVMWPFAIRRERNGEKLLEIYSESVEIDRNLKDNLFSLPANIKLLPQER